jgi:hypothetical protein
MNESQSCVSVREGSNGAKKRKKKKINKRKEKEKGKEKARKKDKSAVHRKRCTARIIAQ